MLTFAIEMTHANSLGKAARIEAAGGGWRNACGRPCVVRAARRRGRDFRHPVTRDCESYSPQQPWLPSPPRQAIGGCEWCATFLYNITATREHVFIYVGATHTSTPPTPKAPHSSFIRFAKRPPLCLTTPQCAHACGRASSMHQPIFLLKGCRVVHSSVGYTSAAVRQSAPRHHCNPTQPCRSAAAHGQR